MRQERALRRRFDAERQISRHTGKIHRLRQPQYRKRLIAEIRRGKILRFRRISEQSFQKIHERARKHVYIEFAFDKGKTTSYRHEKERRRNIATLRLFFGKLFRTYFQKVCRFIPYELSKIPK